ncbi:MAG: NAD-dependent epimerase/dehydratase family protein, partial [Planctomycetes bacterium]|nr:NAD-dependent epimerase/dehydratase family protein [Planctomycetota bacterium]
MKYLITGAAGLLGANFSRYLLSKGHKVVGIDDLSGGYSEFVPVEAVFYRTDLTHA